MNTQIHAYTLHAYICTLHTYENYIYTGRNNTYIHTYEYLHIPIHAQTLYTYTNTCTVHA